MTIDVDLDKIEAFAAQGMTNEQIKDSLGIGRSTYFNKKKNNKDFRDAINRGQAKGVATVTNALFKNATGGNLGAQCFYLKNRAGWADKVEQDISVNLIKPLLPDYLKDAN